MISFHGWEVNIISPATAVTMHGELRLSQRIICEMLKLLKLMIIQLFKVGGQDSSWSCEQGWDLSEV